MEARLLRTSSCGEDGTWMGATLFTVDVGLFGLAKNPPMDIITMRIIIEL